MGHILEFFQDRIQFNSVLIVASFVSVLLLSSQSAASYATYFLALSMLPFAKRWLYLAWEPLCVWILALLGYLTLSSAWSNPFDSREAISVLTRAMLVALFVMAFAESQSRGLVKQWLGKALTLCGSGVAMAAVVVFFVTNPEDGRLNGLGQLDTHVIAALIFGVVMVFALELLITERSRGWRVVAVVCIVATAVAVVLSGSRNAIVSVLAGATVFVAAHLIVRPVRFLVVAGTLAVLATTCLILLYFNEGTREVLLPRGVSFRLDIWRAMFADVWQNGIVFGRGILTPDNIVVGLNELPHAHNMYLSVLYQGGLIGLGLFVGLTGMVLVGLYEHYHFEEAKLSFGVLTIALLSYLLDGHELVDKVGETWFLYWLPVAITLGLYWRRPIPKP